MPAGPHTAGGQNSKPLQQVQIVAVGILQPDHAGSPRLIFRRACFASAGASF
jgi:hypothetical protein